ncbi:MAG: amidohydrolase [Bacteroidales bacterium]|nr:amidohydrolase [Bacteroidales bacterium]
MKTTILQCSLEWEDKRSNIEHLSELLKQTERDTDLVVLPEMFTTAFSMNPAALAESIDGPTVMWMKEVASSGSFAICGSIIIAEEKNFYNRLLFVTPDGDVACYDKRHLHSMSGEQNAYNRGYKQVVYSYKEFNFNLQICYDLRFPVWSRNRGDSDVIIYSANWPEVRINVWKSLLVARAIENQCYVIGANRVGTNPDGTSYSGDSLIVGPKGEIMATGESGRESLISAELSREALDKYRSEMPVWRDADSFTIHL